MKQEQTVLGQGRDGFVSESGQKQGEKRLENSMGFKSLHSHSFQAKIEF